MMTPFLLCFGLGFSAWTFARTMQAQGWRVMGTCRDAGKAAALSRRGIECAVFADDRPLEADLVRSVTHCLISIPPGNGNEADVVLRLHGDDLAAARPSWIGYLSTTGVYGDYKGEWVDEDSPCLPTQLRSQSRLEAEGQWRSFGTRHGVPLSVFRLAGIYGPGRSALDMARAGRAHRIIKPGQVFSRIHVTDIAAALQASCASSSASVYNVCDDDAAPPQDVVAYACELLDVPVPAAVPFDEAVLSPMARSFYADNKRVSNQRIKTELSVALRYPTYREGLRAILSENAVSDDYFPTGLLKK